MLIMIHINAFGNAALLLMALSTRICRAEDPKIERALLEAQVNAMSAAQKTLYEKGAAIENDRAAAEQRNSSGNSVAIEELRAREVGLKREANKLAAKPIEN